MTKTLDPSHQLKLIKEIVTPELLTQATLLDSEVGRAVQNGFQPVPSQNIKVPVEQLVGALRTINETLSGLVELK